MPGKLSKHKDLLWILAAALLIYMQSVGFDYAADDTLVVVENELVQKGASAIPEIFSSQVNEIVNYRLYRPFTQSTYALTKSISGGSPALDHFVNVLLYLVLLFVAYKFAKRLFSDPESKVPFWIVLLFAVHPLHVECVANVKGREDLLCSLFMLLSLIAYMKYTDTGKIKFILLGVLSAIIALFSKEIALTLIGLVVALQLYKKYPIKRTVMFGGVIVLITVGWFLLRQSILSQYEIPEKVVYNNSLRAAESVTEYYVLAFHKIGIYLQNIIAPFDLRWNYDLGRYEESNVIIGAVAGLLTVLLLIGSAIWSYRRSRVFTISVLFIAVPFSLVSNLIIDIDSSMGDRFLFLPLLGVLFMGVYIIHKWKPKQAKFLFTALTILWGGLSIYRTSAWKSSDTLVIRDFKDENSYRSRIAYLGTIANATAGNLKGKDFKVLEENRDFLLSGKFPSIIGKFYNDVGVVYLKRDEEETALAFFDQGMAAGDYYPLLYQNKGDILKGNKDLQGALEVFKEYENYAASEGIQLSAKMLQSITQCYFHQGELKTALGYAERAVLMDPDNQELLQVRDYLKQETKSN